MDYREEFEKYCNEYQSQCGNINFDCGYCETLWLRNKIQEKDKVIEELQEKLKPPIYHDVEKAIEEEILWYNVLGERIIHGD